MSWKKTREVVKNFAKSKKNKYILGSLVVLQLLFFLFCLKKEPLVMMPMDGKFYVQFYTDSNDKGNSIITNSYSSDTVLGVSFILKSGFVRPYVGVSIFPIKNRFLDITGYNTVEIEALGNDVDNLNIHIISHDEKISCCNNKLYSTLNFKIGNERKKIKLNLSSFKIPDWWYDINNLSPSDNIQPDLEKVVEINFATGLTPEVNKERNLSIYSIEFTRNNSRAIVYMVLILLVVLTLLFSIDYFGFVLQESKSEITINYKPVEVVEKAEGLDSYLEYINRNFHNPDLRLEDISLSTGISHRKISEGIANQFHCNVKAYINKIRIIEAQRLLKESDLNISEIAYKVGFSSPNNFNRVFKSITGKNPTEYSSTES